MSNPISTISNLPNEPDEPELEVDEAFSAGAPPPALEVDPIDDRDAHPDAESTPPLETNEDHADKSREGRGLLALILGVLLAGSIAYNLKQSGDVGALEAESQEFALALTAAVERIDQETARADRLEDKLQGITDAVDTVNGRIGSLQVALDELRKATAQ